jgi:hypothetical protein
MLEDGDAGEEQPDGTGRACTPVDEGGLELAELFGGDVAQSLEEWVFDEVGRWWYGWKGKEEDESVSGMSAGWVAKRSRADGVLTTGFLNRREDIFLMAGYLLLVLFQKRFNGVTWTTI